MLLHHYLERNARRLPAKTAVCFKHQNLSYYELNGYANHIAGCLTAEYPPSGHNIGLFLSKSIDAVASLYAVLKSGAAYVPLDVDAPWERTGYIMDDCRLRTIITEATQLLRLIKNCRMLPSSLNILCLGGSERPDFLSGLPAGWQVVMCENQWFDVSAEFNSPEKTEDSLAYILYTSGSTGKPKGVMLSHRNGSTFAQWACQYVGLSSEDVFASHAPFYFDLSVFDIFASCYVGGTLCLLPPGMAWFGDAIADFIQDNAISIWYSVPSALLSLPTVLGDLRTRLSSLRAVIYAGEAFDFHRLNQLRASLSGCDIYNFYGPTETNVITAYRLSHEHQEVLTENLPVGLPCPYAQIRVVGADLQPVGPGEEGELIVNGPSLMKGYWGDADKTRDKVLTVKIDNIHEDFYFTGDMVRQRQDGNLIYINRKDNMVKVRGFRIEPGEIEAALLSFPGILDAAVVAIPDLKIGHRLYAYVEMEQPDGCDNEALLAHCISKVPVWMLPENILSLARLPRTTTGKCDRQSLKLLAYRTAGR